MNLDEFYNYKNQLVNDILTNKSIVRLLNDTVDPDHPESLLYTQVYPFEFIPEVIEDGDTLICIDVDIQKASSKTYVIPTIYVWVFVHKSRLKLPSGGGVRTDAICNEICKTINGSRFYGLGELEFYSSKRFAPLREFNGKMMTFYATDINRVYDGKKPTPTNRRTG